MQAVREKLLLVDGHNLLFQMFYGMPSRIVNREGIAVQGVLGFVGALRKMLALTSPTHVGVLFDSEAPRMRQALDPNYKANRPDYEEIPPEELPLVFDRFHKLDKSRSKNRDGWGLGLYIVKTIVCSHGEDISVASQNDKTTFTFTMPLVN